MTNSRQAIEQAACDAWDFAEVDIVRGRDGWLVAHDGCEQSHYGLDQPFSEVSVDEFARLRVFEEFTTLTLEDLPALSERIPMILDCKSTGMDYQEFVTKWASSDAND